MKESKINRERKKNKRTVYPESSSCLLVVAQNYSKLLQPSEGGIRLNMEKHHEYETQFYTWVNNFNSEGNIESRTGHGRPPVTEQSINLVRSYFRWHPRRAIKQTESDLSIPYLTVRKILRTLIHMFPCKITRVQHLLDKYKVNLVRFAE